MNLMPPKPQDRERVLSQWIEEGLAAHKRGDLDTAELYYKAVLKVVPKQPYAIHLLGMAKYARGQRGPAIKLIQQALAYHPNFALAHVNLGNIYFAQRRFDASLECYDNAVAIEPKYAEAWSNRANALRELGRPIEALEACDTAIALRPNVAELHAHRGLALTDLGRFEEALRCYDTAIALNPQLDFAHLNRVGALYDLEQIDEALRSCEAILRSKPDLVNVLDWRGFLLLELSRPNEAIADFRTAIAVEPDNANVLYNLSVASLAIGDFSAGWSLYDNRFRKASAVSRAAILPAPVWTGQNLKGKRIIVYEEQGLGDIIQFARYLQPLNALGGAVTFLVQKSLQRLLQPLLPSTIRVIETLEQSGRERFDYQCPLLSLPRAFQTSLETIPVAIPYLQAEPDLVDKWHRRIGPNGFKIGIAWQGTTGRKLNRGRSMPLHHYAALADIPGVRLISLQKNHGLEQVIDLPPSMTLETPGTDMDAGPDAFVDTAAIMASMDLIITPDTSIAHLAGALGRPVWVALKQVPDWRWMFTRTDCPWYPTMRLYRQSSRGDWSDVFARIAGDVAEISQ